MRIVMSVVIVSLVLIISISATIDSAAKLSPMKQNPLPSYNVDWTQNSVSGLSAGAAMAHQLHVAYSSLFIGIGMFAGIPYDCAAGNVAIAVTNCMNAFPMQPVATWSSGQANARAALGLVDNTANLVNQKVYLFSGSADYTVRRLVMDTVQSFYSQYITRPGLIQYETSLNAGHTFPTDETIDTSPCEATQSPYISYCGYDGAGIALQHIYSNQLNPRSNSTLTGQLIEFSQSQFIPLSMLPFQVSMADDGYIYVPQSCSSKNIPCKIHIVLHGCQQTTADIGLTYITRTGYLKWADTNNIIILFPQAIKSTLNPKGCWDWWGYNGNPTTYDTNQGFQLDAIRNMMFHLAGKQVDSQIKPLAATE